jgi:hypothetical protein
MGILDQIPFLPDMEALHKRLRIAPGGDEEVELQRLVAEAAAIARPRVHYTIAAIEQKSDHGTEDRVIIAGVTLTSRVLRVNLDQARRVFVYVATCGTELDDWAASKTDMVERYWADTINGLALQTARHAFDVHLTGTYRPGNTSDMHPGSLADWPLSEQRTLFAILGNPAETIGVQLTDNCLMLPTKSVSGLRFPTEERFESCQLCPIENCPSRRAPYSVELLTTKYGENAR